MALIFKAAIFKPAIVPDSKAKPLKLVAAARLFTPVRVGPVYPIRPVIVVVT